MLEMGKWDGRGLHKCEKSNSVQVQEQLGHVMNIPIWPTNLRESNMRRYDAGHCSLPAAILTLSPGCRNGTLKRMA